LGINLSDDFQGDSAFNIGASFRKNGINELGAEWLTRLQLGDRQEFFSEFYQPLDAGSRWFVAPNLIAEAQNVEAVLANDPVAEYRLQRYGYGLNLGRQIANNGEIRFGIGQSWGEANIRVGDRQLPDFSFEEGYYQLQYSFDTLDNVDFPHEGEDIALRLRQYDPALGSDDRYRQWEISLDKAISQGVNTFVVGGRYGRTLNEAEVVTSSFQLGGARKLSGFRQDALSGQNISLARMIYLRQMTPGSFLPLDFPLYIGASLERGRAWNKDNDFDSGYINAGSVFVGYETPLGPLNFSYGLNDEAERALYMNLGRSF
jgi:NTE family protein